MTSFLIATQFVWLCTDLSIKILDVLLFSIQVEARFRFQMFNLILYRFRMAVKSLLGSGFWTRI